ncbi:cation:proton antiporter [Microbacterium mitrae]
MHLPMSTEAESTTAIVSLFWIMLAVFAAPLLSRLLRGYVPDVVLLLGFGLLIGQHGVGLASTDGGVQLVSELGLGLLFLLAGFEIHPRSLGGRQGAFAWATWGVSFLLALALALVVGWQYGFTSAIAVAIALSSTALGTLLPILKQLGITETKLGKAVLANGAVGELAPVLAMAVLLSSHTPLASLVLLGIFGVAVLLMWSLPRKLLAKVPGLATFLQSSAGGTGQLLVRATLLMLVALMAIAAVFELDVVLGAFAAGMVLRQAQTSLDFDLEKKLETIGYGFLIPVFFVVSGMAIDVASVVRNPLPWIVAVVAIWLCRGVPILVSERLFDTGSGLDTPHERRQLALFAATGLPIIVAVTNIAVGNDLMSEGLASALVAAGATTVLLFPLAARLVGLRHARVV